MKNLRTIYGYVSKYPRLISLYFTFNILSSVFALISIGLLSPFLLLIFKKQDTLKGEGVEAPGISTLNPVNYLKHWLYDVIHTPHGDVKALGIICILLLIFMILKNVFFYLSVYFLIPIRHRIANDMRTRMFRRILVLPIGYFNEQRKGDIISRFTNDIAEVENSTMQMLEIVFKEPITILLSFSYMIILSPSLTLFLILFLPLAGFIIGRIGRSLKRQSTEVQQKLGSILSTIDETLSGMRIIKAFNAEKKQDKKLEDQNSELFVIKNKAQRRRDLASPLSEVMGFVAVVCILWYGGRLVLTDAFLDPGDFLAYIFMFTQVIQPLKLLSNAAFNLKRGAASIDRIEHLIAEDVSVKEKVDPVVLHSFEHSVSFNKVSFSYNDKEVLHDIDLNIQKGKSIALVGSSGAGKTTLADLIPRFHDVNQGSITIDGIDLREYSLTSLRNVMGVVTQEPILFNDTIANNIALGMDNPTEEQIISAARIANAHNFIMQKEHGYQTNIGERGSKLSGGERQRLTIARAVLKNPPILILDEATSSLDTESERLVQDAINNLMQNRTSIVIAHRLSTVRHADEIIVLQHGKIIERGNHEVLSKNGGLYQKLIMMQIS